MRGHPACWCILSSLVRHLHEMHDKTLKAILHMLLFYHSNQFTGSGINVHPQTSWVNRQSGKQETSMACLQQGMDSLLYLMSS